MRGPGTLWNVPLNCTPYGSGCAATTLYWLSAMNGGVTLQKRNALGSDVMHIEVAVRPMLAPPLTTPPRPNFPFMRMSTPLNIFELFGANVIRLSTRPRLAGVRLYCVISSPLSGLTSVNGVKSVGPTSWFWIQVRLPNQRR